MSEKNIRSKDGREETAEQEGDLSGLVGEELVVEYRSSEGPVIDGESLVAEPGSVTALIGPNGSGKSTFLKTLANHLSPESGAVRVDGEAVHSLGTKELAQRIGFLSQENTSPDSITVEELVTHGRYPHRGFFEGLTEEDRKAVERAVELAGIEHLRDRDMDSLSGGQKQLAWIAMVLAQDTDVLLLDEPTTFLDLRHQLEVMSVVEYLRDAGDTTVVVVLHDINQSVRYADRVVALKDGCVHASGTPEEVVTEKILADVFGVEATVEMDDEGPRVKPLRPLDEDDA